MTMPDTNVFQHASDALRSILTDQAEFLTESESDDLRVARNQLQAIADEWDEGTLLSVEDDAIMDDGDDQHPRGAEAHG